MSDMAMLITGMPSELKQGLSDEAARNGRSISDEAICLLEEARAQRGCYATGKEHDLRLFFQGTDFRHSDLANAMAILGYAMSALGVPQPITISGRQPLQRFGDHAVAHRVMGCLRFFTLNAR